MMITEHNYEEYFLLYTDNELRAHERKAVEEFVAGHPQYSGLFTALQQTKLPADESLSFFNKKDLYKDETAEIGVNNYEEYFLLYTDNELSEEQKETTERFVLQHPHLQEEFTLLQQAKLAPELVEYQNKAELYKRERRVLPLYFTGASVAAAVLAVLFFTGVFTPRHQSGNTVTAVAIVQDNKTPQPPQPTVTTPADTKAPPEENAQKNAVATNAVTAKPEKKKAAAEKEQNRSVTGVQSLPPAREPHSSDIAIATVPEEKQSQQVVSLPDNNTAARQATVLKPLQEFDAGQMNTTALSLSGSSSAQTEVYKELNTDDDNHTLYVSGVPLNKNKISGFLKSTSRLLGSHAKQNEE